MNQWYNPWMNQGYNPGMNQGFNPGANQERKSLATVTAFSTTTSTIEND